jgi:NitT/TauT family transport system substrate-binding protein
MKGLAMKRAERSAAALAAATVGLLLAAGCRQAEPEPATSPAEPPLLKVGHVGHDHHLALYVAALEGPRFQKDYGIGLKEVKPQEVYDLVDGSRTLARLLFLKVGGGAQMPAAMSRGEIQIGLGSVPAVAKFADEGQPFRIIAPLQTDGDMLVMHKDSPIADWAGFVQAARVAEKPLKIGYKAPTAVAKLVFERALKAEDIPFGYDAADAQAKVILVNFGSEQSPVPLLESRALDGFVMNQPGCAVAVHKGLGRIAADLCDLPPKGRWLHHPCCCVAATDETLKAYPEALKGFLKVIHLATQIIRDEPAVAVDCAVRWTKTDREIEAASVPTNRYISEPTDAWVAGMRTWAEMAADINLFSGRYAQMTPDAFVQDVCALDLCREAARELRAKGLLKSP